MELLNFDNLAQTLEEYAQEVRNLYQDKLITNDRISSGKLLNSVEYQVTNNNGQEWVVSLSLEDYWKFIEYGIYGKENMTSPFKNPGWKAYYYILKWITTKPVIPRPGKDGKIPTPATLAGRITASIAKNGIEAGGELQDTLDEVNARYKEKLVIALRKDSENIMKVLVGGFNGSVPTYPEE